MKATQTLVVSAKLVMFGFTSNASMVASGSSMSCIRKVFQFCVPALNVVRVMETSLASARAKLVTTLVASNVNTKYKINQTLGTRIFMTTQNTSYARHATCIESILNASVPPSGY